MFFFFQAEDGIRDWSVTGVQTCAIPILPRACDVVRGQARCARRPRAPLDSVSARGGALVREAGRSEERRVGKECRSRWGRDDGKKKGGSTRGVAIGGAKRKERQKRVDGR